MGHSKPLLNFWRAPSRRCAKALWRRRVEPVPAQCGSRYAGEFHGKFRPAIFFRKDADSAAVRLNNLINDGKPKSSSTHECRLQRFKNLCALLRIEPHPRIAKPDADPKLRKIQRYRQNASGGHSAQGVVGQVPKHLFDTIAIYLDSSLRRREVPFDPVFSVQLRIPLE